MIDSCQFTLDMIIDPMMLLCMCSCMLPRPPSPKPRDKPGPGVVTLAIKTSIAECDTGAEKFPIEYIDTYLAFWI